MLEVLYHHANFGGGSDFSRFRSGQNVEFLFICLSVRLSVTLLRVTDCAPDLAIEYRKDSDTVG